ncbi:MAG: metallophosphoesterase [Thermoplasmatota archaeon]
MRWFAVSDLHGRPNRYLSLFREVERNPPPAVLMGGDLLPRKGPVKEFMDEFLFRPIRSLRKSGIRTRFLVIMGNDDPKAHEHLFFQGDEEGVIDYIPMKTTKVHSFTVAGYPYIHPSPFLLKDWELYDVSRYVDPGCVSPPEGIHTTDQNTDELRFHTIKDDLDELARISDPKRTIYLFHSPPFETNLDMADIGSQKIDSVPLNPHIGSVAIKRFIEGHQPPVTIHGHVHESFHMTGRFHQRIKGTLAISACGTEKGLPLIEFDPEGIMEPTRRILDRSSFP